jgi:hypothetical protein
VSIFRGQIKQPTEWSFQQSNLKQNRQDAIIDMRESITGLFNLCESASKLSGYTLQHPSFLYLEDRDGNVFMATIQPSAHTKNLPIS